MKMSSLESSYTYDDNSNRLSYTGPLGNATGTYDERDRMLTYGGASYTWTEAGELASKTEGGETTAYDYDVFGNLRKVSLANGIEIEYLTDGAQRRIGKRVNGVLAKQWIYQNHLESVAELDGFGELATRFVYGTRRHVPDYLRKDGDSFRYVADQIGSVRLIINTISGVVAQELRYDEFGRLVLDTNPNLQPFYYAGGANEVLTDLVRHGARDFDPNAGRWTASDPIRFRGKSANLFEYAFSQPIHRLDPSGLWDVVLGVEADLVDWGGAEGGAGIVIDLDDLPESGLTVNAGPAIGMHAGVGVGVACLVREAEGLSLGADANLPHGLSLQIFLDDQGFNGAGASLGPGGGFSLSLTDTKTLTARGVMDGIGKYLDDLGREIERQVLGR